MNCRRCEGDLAEGRSAPVCIACARAIRDGMESSLLLELNRYWERRLLEKRERDWT